MAEGPSGVGVEFWLDGGEPELFDGAEVELSGGVSECAEHLADVVITEYDAFAEVVCVAWVALQEESVDDAAVVGDDIADIDTERGVRGVRVRVEQDEI